MATAALEALLREVWRDSITNMRHRAGAVALRDELPPRRKPSKRHSLSFPTSGDTAELTAGASSVVVSHQEVAPHRGGQFSTRGAGAMGLP